MLIFAIDAMPLIASAIAMLRYAMLYIRHLMPPCCYAMPCHMPLDYAFAGCYHAHAILLLFR